MRGGSGAEDWTGVARYARYRELRTFLVLPHGIPARRSPLARPAPHRAGGEHNPERRPRARPDAPLPRPRTAARKVGALWARELAARVDVQFGEDRSRLRSRRGAENMALLRRLALRLLAQDGDTAGGVKGKRERAAWDPDYLPRLLHLCDA